MERHISITNKRIDALKNDKRIAAPRVRVALPAIDPALKIDDEVPGRERRNAQEHRRAGELLRQARERTGLTAGETARLIGVTGSSLWAYERGKTGPKRIDTAYKIASYFGLDVGSLWPSLAEQGKNACAA